ncbi:MAG: PH domain-containing protein [Planctomycetota bacterium]
MDDTHDDLPPKSGRPATGQSRDAIDRLHDGQGPIEEDEEITYYEGSPLLRGELGLVTLWIVVGLILVAAPILLLAYTDGNLRYWSLLAVPVGLLVMFVPALWVKRNRYKITNYRIDREFGLVVKNYDTLELWHVNDVRMRQGPLDRLFGVGTIHIDADDRSTPELELRSLAKPRQLLESLKQRVIAVKRQRGVIKMDMGG